MICRYKDPKKKSACTLHLKLKPGHQIDFDNVEILDTASSDFKLRMKELLHILKLKPILNKQLNSQSNYDIKTIIIAAYPQFRNIITNPENYLLRVVLAYHISACF